MRDLKRMSEINGPMTAAMKQAARNALEPVAAITKAALPQSDRNDAKRGQLAGDVRVGTTRTGGSLRMGRAAIRYAGWIEFGGTRRTPHESTREYDSKGRYLWPNAVQLAPMAGRLYELEVSKVLAAFHWTNETNDGSAIHD